MHLSFQRPAHAEEPTKLAGRRLAELRRSNAAGTHGDRRTKRLRDRAAQRRFALNDQRS